MRGIRTRLALTLVALVALTVAAIGAGTYLFVDARLREAALADATRQAQFNLSVLVPDRLAAGAGSDEFATSGLPEAFRLRGDVEVIADFGEDVYVSNSSLQGKLGEVSAPIRGVVESGHLGYAWQSLGGTPVLIVAGKAPAGSPAIYFLSPAASIE